MSVDGVYIKNMEMPPAGCILIVFPSGRVLKVSSDQTQNIYGEAEAVPVPPHGRLIDADDTENITVIMNENGSGFNRIVAPTIIPASKEGET